jgi:hypothetical protein
MSGISGLIRPLTLAPGSAPTAAPATVAGERSQPRTGAKASGAGTAISPLSSGGGGQSGGGQSGGSGGGSANPSINFSGTNVVGGFGEVVLTAPKPLQSVTWQVSGAVQNPQNPPLTNSQGAAPTPLANPDQVPQSGQSAILDFYWNLQTGNHTISASVVYANNKGTGNSNVITVNVVAPTVNAFQVSYTPYTWGQIPAGPLAGQTGFYDTLTYSATVSLPAGAKIGQGSAQIAFIQTISANWSEPCTISGQHTKNTGGMVLDNVPNTGPNGTGYLLNNATYGPVPSGGQYTIPAPLPTDCTAVPWQNAGGGDTCTEVNVTTQFATNLVFKTGTGIWVGLSVTTPVLTLQGDEVWNANNNQWVQGNMAPSPGQAGNLTGNNNLTWVTWNGYFTSFPWVKPF